MLSEPVSAQEEGGFILIFITGVTCEENEIEDRVFLMLFPLISNFFSPLIFFLVPPGAATRPSTLDSSVPSGGVRRVHGSFLLSGIFLLFSIILQVEPRCLY